MGPRASIRSSGARPGGAGGRPSILPSARDSERRCYRGSETPGERRYLRASQIGAENETAGRTRAHGKDASRRPDDVSFIAPCDAPACCGDPLDELRLKRRGRRAQPK